MAQEGTKVAKETKKLQVDLQSVCLSPGDCGLELDFPKITLSLKVVVPRLPPNLPISPRQPWDALSESQHLECYSGNEPLIEEIHMLGHLDFKEALPYSIGPAQHVETVELSFCLRGRMRWNVGGEVVAMAAGDVLITPPGVVHWGEDSHFSPVEVFWLRVRKGFSFLTGRAKEDARSWKDARSGFHARAEGEVENSFRTLLREHQKPDDFSVAICRAALQHLFLSVARSLAGGQSVPNPAPPFPPKLRRALDLLDQELETVLPMEELARKVDCPSDVLRRFFRSHLGLTPLEYQNAQRVTKAKTMLQEGKFSITAIAHELGFSSSQYFSTFFHKNVGVTPREYRAGGIPVPEEVFVDY